MFLYQSGEEAARNGRKGGIASGESKRERKTIQNLLNDFLYSNVKDQKSLKGLRHLCDKKVWQRYGKSRAKK